MIASKVFFTWDGDYAQRDPFLMCAECGEKLCTAEEGDTLELIMQVAEAHRCEDES